MAQCSSVTETVGRASIETTTLKFQTTEDIPARPDLAFVIRDTGGEYFLIGAREHPFPIVKKQWSTGKHDGEPACWTVEVTMTARRSLIICV